MKRNDIEQKIGNAKAVFQDKVQSDPVPAFFVGIAVGVVLAWTAGFVLPFLVVGAGLLAILWFLGDFDEPKVAEAVNPTEPSSSVPLSSTKVVAETLETYEPVKPAKQTTSRTERAKKAAAANGGAISNGASSSNSMSESTNKSANDVEVTGTKTRGKPRRKPAAKSKAKPKAKSKAKPKAKSAAKSASATKKRTTKTSRSGKSA